MKKFKSILCGALAFVAGSVVLSACGAKTEPNETPTQQQEQQQEITVGAKTIIPLSEAKAIILRALAIEDNQLQTQSTRGMVLHATDASEGNRDILEKLGNFTFDERDYDNEINDDPMNEDGLHHFSGQATYDGHEFKTALIKEGNGQEVYYSNSESLRFFGDVATIKPEPGYGEAGNFIIYQSLFDDEAFDNIYDDTATKETNKDGYSITLTGDFEKWSYLGSPLEECDVNYFNVTVNIDGNNDVINAVVSFQFKYKETISTKEGTTTQNKITTSTMTFTKTNKPITEPDWVTEYKQAHA
ncbi:MAG: hypothetical protein MJ060_04100 [Clostridia bacterium]|nr:hypothetical protein [Clostridia bacterium]